MTTVDEPLIELAHRITVNAAEAARLLGISETTFRAWAAEPDFPSFVPPGGRRRQYPVDALRRWVNERAARQVTA